MQWRINFFDPQKALRVSVWIAFLGGDIFFQLNLHDRFHDRYSWVADKPEFLEGPEVFCLWLQIIPCNHVLWGTNDCLLEMIKILESTFPIKVFSKKTNSRGQFRLVRASTVGGRYWGRPVSWGNLSQGEIRSQSKERPMSTSSYPAYAPSRSSQLLAPWSD